VSVLWSIGFLREMPPLGPERLGRPLVLFLK